MDADRFLVFQCRSHRIVFSLLRCFMGRDLEVAPTECLKCVVLKTFPHGDGTTNEFTTTDSAWTLKT